LFVGAGGARLLQEDREIDVIDIGLRDGPIHIVETVSA